MPDFATISKRLKANKDAYPPGRFSFGTQNYGGPAYTDAFKSRRGPSLVQLVENYGAMIYAMADRNKNAVARLPMRLMMDGSRGQGGPPSRAADGIKVSRAVGQKLAESGQISTAAIDQVYEIRNHPLLDTVKNPDPYGTFTLEQFIGFLSVSMDILGSAYIVPEGNGWDWRNEADRAKGPPQFLWIIYGQYVIAQRGAANPIVEWFQYFNDRLPRDSVLWMRNAHSLRDVYGAAYGPTYAGEPYRQQEQEQVAILSQALGLGPRPSMVISPKDALMPFGEDEAAAYERDLNRKLSGPGAGGLLVLRSPLDATPISYPPADLAGKEISEHDIYMLAAIFGQPPTFYTVDSNLANLQAARQQHWENGVEPRCKTIAGCFTRLAKQYDHRLMFQFDHGLPDDELVKAQCTQIRLNTGLTTINEENEETKHPKKPWGDAPWLNGSLKQPDMIMEAHEQSLEQADQQMMSGGIDDNLKVDQHEHTKKMDKAQMQADKEERMLNEMESIIRTIKGELERRAS